MTLVDTSVWIAVFSRRAPLDLERYVAFDDVSTCLPIVQEVLQGFRDERAHRVARAAMLALPRFDSPATEEVFLLASDLYRAARRRGVTVRSSVDCLITATALRHDVEVLHADRDFSALARVCAVKERRV